MRFPELVAHRSDKIMVKWTHVKRSTAPDGPGPGRPRKTIVKRQVVTRATHEDIARSLSVGVIV